MEPQSLAFDFLPINFGSRDGDGMPALSQAEPHGDVRMQIAKGTESREKEMLGFQRAILAFQELRSSAGNSYVPAISLYVFDIICILDHVMGVSWVVGFGEPYTAVWSAIGAASR
jgi:hypothetical protein